MNDSERTNPLEAYFRANPGHRINKWRHYFDIYHRHFEGYRNEAIAMVEFGVAHGGSLQMWKDHFDPRSRIYGVDSVVVFEKGGVRRPRRKRTGQPAFERSPRRVEEGA
jgi:hypothetical protein